MNIVNSKSIDTIIFDFDGTLADTADVFYNIAKDLIKRHKLDIKEEKLEQIRHTRIVSLKKFKKEYGIGPLQALRLVKQARDAYGREYRNIMLFKEIKQVLEELYKRGYRLGILSSMSDNNITKVIQKENLKMFTFVHYARKLFDKATALNKILKRYNLNKESVIYVGDEVRDIKASQQVGIKSGAVTWGFNNKEILKDSNPDILWEEPKDILHTFDQYK